MLQLRSLLRHDLVTTSVPQKGGFNDLQGKLQPSVQSVEVESLPQENQTVDKTDKISSETNLMGSEGSNLAIVFF